MDAKSLHVFCTRGGDYINEHEIKSYIDKLLHALHDGLEDMTKTDEYRKYVKQNTHFNYPPEVMAKIKEHNPAYTKAATSGTWESVFGRAIKKGEKPFSVNIANNQSRWLFDISQTAGKPPVALYKDIVGNVLAKSASTNGVNYFHSILDCLIKLSPMTIVFRQGASYYSGIGQDSFIQDGKIVLRSKLSEKQVIFALCREIIRHNQKSAVVVEAVSYMVCRHLNIDTSPFTFGYLLELMGFDESRKILKDRTVQNTIHNEAEVFIGYLNANLPFLQEDTESADDNAASDTKNSTTGGVNGRADYTATYGADGKYLVVSDKSGRTESSGNSKTPRSPHTFDKPSGGTPTTTTSHSVEVHTETVYDIDFRFLKIIREYTGTMPDNSINLQAVRSYGYLNTKMLPISFSVASRLLSAGREIFKLYKDNTEELVETIEDAKKHKGYFGISKEEWATAQVEIIRAGVDGAINSINRWNRGIIPDAIQEAKIRKMQRDKLQAEKSAQMQMQTVTQKSADTQAQTAAQALAQAQSAAVPQAINNDSLIFTADGSVVIIEDDIDYKEIENNTWLEKALPVFFKQTGYREINMPYFVSTKNRKKHGDFIITPEMAKINSLMGYYCSDYISRVLNSKRYKKRNSKTGKIEYKVKSAVALVCENYSVEHIVYALDKFRANIKAPRKIKMAFDKCLELMSKNQKAKPRRETPDESIRRVKAAEEAKTGAGVNNMGENTKVNTGQSGNANPNAVNERNAEIYHIIKSYKQSTAAKSKKEADDLPILPPIPTMANKTL